MCGIGAIVRITPADASGPAGSGAIPEAWLDALDSAIAFRGPDGAGRFCDSVTLPDGARVEVAIVHRRLAIIDLEGGAQPMRTPDAARHVCCCVQRVRVQPSRAARGADPEGPQVPHRSQRHGGAAARLAWLDIFETRARASGAEVLWARDGDEVARLVVDIARRHGVTKDAKSKSLLSEEAQLNEALAAAGIRPVETDLGEYIVQLAG